MHQPTDRIAHTTAFFYTSRGALAGMEHLDVTKVLHYSYVTPKIC